MKKSVLYGAEEQEKDRDRGILSTADREFLTSAGANLNSEQSRRNARRRIRNRIQNAIIDFDLIARLLDDEDRNLVFEEEDEHYQKLLQVGQKSMVEFLYSGLEESDAEMDFDTILKSGVHDAEIERHDSPSFVSVDFDVDTNVEFDLEDARERFENESSLTMSEVGGLIASGTVEDPDEVQRLAELAREKGVVESSVSPMRADYYVNSQRLNLDFERGDSFTVPVGNPEHYDTMKMLTRSEPHHLLDVTIANAEDDE